MFDFENLDVYKKAKELNKEILRFLITEDLSKDFYRKLETISKMLLGLINSQITR